MKSNARHILWSSAVAAALAGCFLACGGESEPTADQSAAATPAPAEEPAGAAPGAPPIALEDMYQWNPAAGAPRNLAADTAECQAQITAEGLAGVAQHIQCMQRLGWQTRSPAS